MEKINVGSNICGYVVKAVANGYCLARNPDAPNPWVIWEICEGDETVRNGTYRCDRTEAEICFWNTAFLPASDKLEAMHIKFAFSHFFSRLLTASNIPVSHRSRRKIIENLFSLEELAEEDLAFQRGWFGACEDIKASGIYRHDFSHRE